MAVDTGTLNVGRGATSFGLPVVTKQDLAQYALWAFKHAQATPSEIPFVKSRLRRLLPILLHPDQLMLAERFEEAGGLWAALAMEIKASLDAPPL